MKNNIIIILVNLIFLCLFQSNALKAQCNQEGHSTNTKDSWLSCETSENPNAARGESHWLQYDLGYIYTLGTTKFWNYNVVNATQNGFRQIAIDYSFDGDVWSTAGTFELPEAEGDAGYEGTTGIDLTGISARYVLVTALSNWKNGACAGLSEVRFAVSSTSTCGDFTVTQNIGDGPINAGSYYSHDNIDSDGKVKNGTIVSFQAANTIHLKTGFTAEAGSQFLAKIATCNLADNKTNNSNLSRQAEPLFEYEENAISIKIYPNPTVHLLNIDFTEAEIREIMIINMAGHEILRRQKGQNLHQIDVSSLPSGMYLLNLLTSNHQILTKRFIKVGL